ncbi:MAG TPA: 1-acyl-sn-glycerol-3-phosphate acyltransferase [Planctomycetota bacterium]|nr:1-acyl-sn-glycerol-3-phosphate acyltransferase [Planctomycetota bacterium]
MQNIVIAEPYRFVPPHRGGFWPWLFGRFLVRSKLRTFGVEQVQFNGLERLRASFADGHGVMLTPNHCRPCDPFIILALLAHEGRSAYSMASWHLFKQSWMQTWFLRHAGVFSVYREGLDRESLRLAFELLAEAKRPLVLFPEGVVTRSNDRLINLMEGTSFIARNAAKARGDKGKVVVHPVAIRYLHEGDTAAAVASVLLDIERRLSWRMRPDLPILERIAKVGDALLALKEIEHLGAQQPGSLADRIDRLVDHLLVPLEQDWRQGKRDDNVVARVKALRIAIVPDLASGDLNETERVKRWRHLEDCYLAQQLSLYPRGYLENATSERLLETVERFDEDLTDDARIHRPMRAIVDVGEAIPVSAQRDRAAAGDPLMEMVRTSLETMLAASRRQS